MRSVGNPNLPRSGSGAAVSIRAMQERHGGKLRGSTQSFRCGLARVPIEADRGRFSEMARQSGLDGGKISALIEAARDLMSEMLNQEGAPTFRAIRGCKTDGDDAPP
jgi:hypothetical protein